MLMPGMLIEVMAWRILKLMVNEVDHLAHTSLDEVPSLVTGGFLPEH